MASTDPNMSQTNTQQTTWYMILVRTHEPSQIATRFQLVMLGGVEAILEPVLESNTNLILYRVRLNEPWTQTEHGPILEPNTHLIFYGTWLHESWALIEHEIPQEVQGYVAGFFMQVPTTTYPPQPTYPHDLNIRHPTFSATYPMSPSQNIMVGPYASNSMPVIVNQTLQILVPVPMNVPFLLVPRYTEASSSTNTIVHQSQSRTSDAAASTSMNVTADEEIDLELRLGRRE
ncbi:unnamed protein product [Sphenostylis stenocarpa]|uniref:Uncharacterized protein n=1 Tax=Sphenostylis stenocarpa TaxID=92480 RepID=A0AA86VDK1_9FABA|nr:unnamed protein product [Sphenostylis stenocarpa]